MQTDYLVIGSGIAGLTYAVKVATAKPSAKVVVLTKTFSDETNTKYAQGGIAGVWDAMNDSFEKHIEDTLIAGDGLCNADTVKIVVTEGPQRIREIIEWGAQFDLDADGDYALGREGGHSEHRILHHKDVTGKEMERALLQKVASLPTSVFLIIILYSILLPSTTWGTSLPKALLILPAMGYMYSIWKHMP